VSKEVFLTAHEKTAQRVQTTPVKLIDDAVREFRYGLEIKAEVNLLIALLTAASNADNKFTVANLYNGFRRSFDAFRNAVKVFKSSALAERNPFLAESLFAIEDKLITLGEGDHSLFKLRLLEFKAAEQLSGLLANHRKQAARLTAHATALVDAVRGEIADLREEMAYWRMTGASILVTICLGSVLIAGLIVHFTARRLSRHESDLRDAKTTAEMANRELEAFNYSVSHDLLAPLRTLDGFSQALLEDYGDKLDDTGKRYLGFLRDGSHDMRKLIDGLLALSRSNRGELTRERVNLSELAKEIMATHQGADPARKVRALVAPMIEAEGDPSLLKTLLENLLGNAWKYSSKTPEARIEFGAEQDTDGTFYYVRDNGVGFDMTYQDRLFVPFRRLHKSDEFEGSGIGLATVQRIIHRHGGRIWAQAAIGKGATFHFTLGS
jgi:signal transduction histidine kinase